MYLFINFKSLDIDEPPRAHLVLDIIGHQLPKLNSQHPPKILHNIGTVVQCFRQMLPLLRLHNHRVVFSRLDNVLLDFWNVSIITVEFIAIRNYETL